MINSTLPSSSPTPLLNPLSVITTSAADHRNAVGRRHCCSPSRAWKDSSPSPYPSSGHAPRLLAPSAAFASLPSRPLDHTLAICDAMEEHQQKQQQATFLELMISRLRSTSRYCTGYPKDLGPSRIIHFTSERQFVQLLHEGNPVAVAFTIRCPYTKHLDTVLEEAAAEFYPGIKFVRVECPKFPGFCITRQRKEYPFIEIFHSPEQVANQGKAVDPSITKYSVKVFPYNYDISAYGFREFFKKHGMFGETK